MIQKYSNRFTDTSNLSDTRLYKDNYWITSAAKPTTPVSKIERSTVFADASSETVINRQSLR